MGAGLGLTVYSDVKIGLPSIKCAMPEARIGLFTDVSGGYFLSRMSSGYGNFLGLTAYTLEGIECHQFGLVDSIVDDFDTNQLVQDCVHLS